ncbi:ankyrin repeat domain-containing protein [Paenibacillus sp.]|uniref:ankyrin repeat domain-containing protein n=1 Tax=Paenibacillus sp. TaxID=58172 RepID=UPI002D707764|nr:ankyrin repeat domain-containing protein [Paenibacillus sp.]HZG56315.1 ankyrin repeat domain-containing protein [Paenibacillus sp.]
MSIEQLVQAASSGDTETMQTLLEQHPALAEQTLPSGMSPLMAAMYYGKQAAVEWLLERGVKVTIHEAAALGDDETIDYMLKLEPQLLMQYSFDGWTPLHLAAFFGGFEAAKLLIERGADVNARSTNAMSNMPIHAASAGNRTNIVALLLEKGADPNARQSGGWTPIHQAANHCDAEMTKLLLRYGADPDVANDDGKTARAMAEEKGYTEVTSVLP